MPVSKLTIAVPVYNERERVGQALKELLSTPLPVETEVIVVDDGSTDGTWEQLAQLPLPEHVRLIRHKENHGKGAALRTALEAATGDVFVPFDADLEYDPSDLAGCLVPLIRDDAERLREAGVAAVFTPKDFDLTRLMGDVARLVAAAHGDGR